MERSIRETDRNTTIVRARELRRSPTLPEGLLWQQLRGRPRGLKFRRQQPMGPFVIDFYCPAVKLVVEVDGHSHDMGERPAQDAARDRWLRERGLRVVRFNAADVMKDVSSAVVAILMAARASYPSSGKIAGPPPQSPIGEDGQASQVSRSARARSV